MFINWLRPVSQDKLKIAELSEAQLGRHAAFLFNALTDLEEAQVALIGTEARHADAVRGEFYQLSQHFEGLRLVDMGNLRRGGTEFLIPLLRELTDSQIFPLIIGSAPSAMVAQYKAFQLSRAAINLLAIDSRIPFQIDAAKQQVLYGNELMEDHSHNLCHLGIIGYQNHFASPLAVADLEAHNFECLRLGNAKADMAELEPLIRDADLGGFHLAAVRSADAPGQGQPNPSGFSAEEACQICRYAGMSDKLKSFGIYGFDSKLDLRGQTAQVVAQMLWYFLDGFHNRKADFPMTNKGLTEYIVDLKHGEQLVFWKSTKSGRWWIQVPAKVTEAQQRHRLIPCSHKDYKLACQGELPDRLLNAFKRFL